MSSTHHVSLFGQWRSSASWRVRIVLALKGIKYTHCTSDVDEEERGLPVLVFKRVDSSTGNVLSETRLEHSIAIIEFLEEIYPAITPLLPKLYQDRASVRKLVHLMCSDIQPLYRHRVLNNLAGLNCDGNKWAKEWISIGFDALEKELAIYAKKYCVGDQLTLADVCLVPLVYEAYRHAVDMKRFPIIYSVYKKLQFLPAFTISHPESQPDCPDKQ